MLHYIFSKVFCIFRKFKVCNYYWLGSEKFFNKNSSRQNITVNIAGTGMRERMIINIDWKNM